MLILSACVARGIRGMIPKKRLGRVQRPNTAQNLASGGRTGLEVYVATLEGGDKSFKFFVSLCHNPRRVVVHFLRRPLICIALSDTPIHGATHNLYRREAIELDTNGKIVTMNPEVTDHAHLRVQAHAETKEMQRPVRGVCRHQG